MAKARFSTHAHIKSIIGKDLITDDNNAVLELVKNSFDAGSKKVDITFSNILENNDSKTMEYPTSKTSKLVIRDEGVGMSEDDIINKWLNIAYSEKKEQKENFGRVLAGNKGVGRFSCDRLGRFLTIYTRVEGKNYNKLCIDWRVFEDSSDINFNIQDVEFEISSLSENEFLSETNYSGLSKGTILEISFLRELWHSTKILSLKRQLERLINPNQAFKKNRFEINIEADEFSQYDKGQEDYNKINGPVTNKIFEKLDFRTTSIQSSIDEKGEYITTTLQDRGHEIFLLKERNTYSQLSNISITIFYLNTYAKAYFTKQTGIKSVDFGSVFLFINGFRIPPYGDIGDDWLGMEIRKGQGHSRYLGTREVVGRIEINDENEKFKIISNRSGVVNNVAFEQLTKQKSPFGYYFKIFRRLERFVVEGLKWDSSPIDSNRIEKEVFEENWTVAKEIYNEDFLERNKRVLLIVESIIDAKKEDIIDLKINDDFVKDLIIEQTQRAKEELEQALASMQEKSKRLSPEFLTQVISKISQQSNSLNKFSNEISKFSTSESTIEELSYLEDLNKKLEFEREQINNIKTSLEEKLRLEKEARLKAEENERLAKEALEIERDKNTYLLSSKRSMSEDAKGLIHNIKQTSKLSKQNAQRLYDAFIEENVKPKQALSLLSTIIYNSDKALKISNLITRANFKANADYQDVNIVKFIEQYLGLYNVMFDDNQLEFLIETELESFLKRISILDLSLVIDDLISNSIKAKANIVKVSITLDENSDLIAVFTDDGTGVPSKFLSNTEAIFDLGVTTTDGSGIGLNYVRKTLTKMNGTISFIGNNKYLKGASFMVKISKAYK